MGSNRENPPQTKASRWSGVEASRAKLRRAATAVTRSTSAAWAALTHHLPHPPETWKSAAKARQARVERDLALIEHTDTLHSALGPYMVPAGKKSVAAHKLRKVFDGRHQGVTSSRPGHEQIFGVGVMGFLGFADGKPGEVTLPTFPSPNPALTLPTLPTPNPS